MPNLTLTPEFPEKLEMLFQPSRYKVLYGGRGGAKSWGVARALLLQGFERPLRVLCAREFQNSIRDSVHKLLSDQVDGLGLGGFYDCQAAAIKGKNGTEFAFEGLRHNISRIKSYEGVDRVWVEEAHSVSKPSWEVLIPTIRKDGSEIWVTFNPEFEDDETYQRFVLTPPRDALVAELNWRDNPWFPEVLRQEKDELQRRDPAAYEHVWEGKCRQWLEGAIYANELRRTISEGRIRQVEHDPAVAVYTAWDLGHTDSTAIWWFQIVRGEIHILESYASDGESLNTYATQILGKQVEIDLIQDRVVARVLDPVPGLEHRMRYKYAKHWLPHDARAKTLAAQGKTIVEQLASVLGISRMGIVPDIGLEDGIQAVRTMFHRCYFDATGCADGLKALRKYQRELQPDEKSLKKNPKHDWTSHYSDAFRMLGVAWRHERPAEPDDTPRAIIKRIVEHKPTLDELWEAHDDERGRIVKRI